MRPCFGLLLRISMQRHWMRIWSITESRDCVRSFASVSGDTSTFSKRMLSLSTSSSFTNEGVED